MTASVLARDPATGALGAAVASPAAGTGRDLVRHAAAHGALVVAAPADARRLVALLDAGRPLADAEVVLRAEHPGFEGCQLSAMTAAGAQWVSTGARCPVHHGDVSGPGWVVAGSSLANAMVIAAMAEALARSGGAPLVRRMLGALEAGRAEGGFAGAPARSAVLRVIDGRTPAPLVDLRVADGDDAVAVLRDHYEALSVPSRSDP